MKGVSILENKTKDKIIFSSFKLFLEHGYEATNIRGVCKEAGIKASTMYFYFKSKQDLFFYIYDEICSDYLNFLKEIETSQENNSTKTMLHRLFKLKLQYFTRDITKLKFIFRYHLFPPEEIVYEIREKYKSYTDEENRIILDKIMSIMNSDDFKKADMEEFLFEYKRLENHFVYEMITSGIKINEKTVDKIWDIFWNSR